MTDEITDDKCNDKDEKCDLTEEQMEEYRHTLLALHDQLDEIKKTARTINGDLEIRGEGLSREERQLRQPVIQMAVTLYERVDRGDYQLVRGM